MGGFVFGQRLDEQFFADTGCTSRAASAGDDGRYELRPIERHLFATFIALDHDLLWAPPVGPTEVTNFLDFVVRRDALDYSHTITSSSLFLYLGSIPKAEPTTNTPQYFRMMLVTNQGYKVVSS
jgi:hypothetical protein